ncbi:MAG: glycosyltransferase family 4 protein [Actinomycetota bacterium]|nr:glycosyltransferase family 4 protein [Actinomycetota bacterium]
MILGVDGLRLLGNRSGVGRVLEALLEGLGEVRHPFDEIRVYTPEVLDDSRGLPAGARNVIVPSHLAPGLWQQISLPRAARLDSVLLCPSYVAPVRPRCPTVLIHHGSYEGYPAAFPWFDRTKARILYAVSAHRATTVSTVSESSRRDMARFYCLDPATIHVIPDGVDTRRFRRLDHPARLFRWREQVLGADVPFLLHVGKPTRRRNLPALLEAFAEMKQHDGIPHRLVFVGTDLARSPVAAVVERLGLVGEVHTIGFSSHEELVVAYNAASLFVYPSSYEGFGMPVL